jgi:GT2 family glycosyltransferase
VAPTITWRGAPPSLGSLGIPIGLVEVELSEPLPRLEALPRRGVEGVEPDGAVLALLRMHRAPVGTLALSLSPDGIDPAALAEHIWRHSRAAILDHLRRDRLPAIDVLDPSGVPGPAVPECRRRLTRVLASAPPATVVIATRERPQELQRALESVLRLNYPDLDVVVVDNDPQTDATTRLIRTEFAGTRIRYVREDQRGLAAAHNRGISISTGEILAFTDDDVVVDPDWLAHLAEGFTLTDSVGAVTGLIHPAELRTRTQALLEQHGGYTKGFSPRVFDLRDQRPDDPLYPFTAGQFGSGANMAFDAATLRDLGGFDPSMGTGTPARGGDDLVALFAVVASGRRLVYQPAAVVHHFHRSEAPALSRQAFGYGVGLGAYLTNVAVHHPRLALKTAKVACAAATSAVRQRSTRNAARYDGWPRQLTRLERRGIALGPIAYARSAWQVRHVARPGRDGGDD